MMVQPVRKYLNIHFKEMMNGIIILLLLLIHLTLLTIIIIHMEEDFKHISQLITVDIIHTLTSIIILPPMKVLILILVLNLQKEWETLNQQQLQFLNVLVNNFFQYNINSLRNR